MRVRSSILVFSLALLALPSWLLSSPFTATPTWTATPSDTSTPTPPLTASPSDTSTPSPSPTVGTGSYTLSPAAFVAGSSGNGLSLTFNTQGAFWPGTGGILTLFFPSTLGTPSAANFYPDSGYTSFVNSAGMTFVTATPGPGPSGEVVQVPMSNLIPNQNVVFLYGDNPPVPGPAGFSVGVTNTPQNLIVSANPSDPNPADVGGVLQVQPTIQINTPGATFTDTPTVTPSNTPATATPSPTPSPTFTITPTYTITPIGAQVGTLYSYPNPFDLQQYTKCTFRFPDDPTATIEVFNLVGEPVCNIPAADINGAAGWAIWTGTDDFNRYVAGGIYFVRVRGARTWVRKITVLK